ncbi:MAG: ParB/RepB/Spo0J family partition protein [candidate division WOR-3 bacterium]
MLRSAAEYPVKEIPVNRISVFIERDREPIGFQELVESIRVHGLIVPVTVVERSDGRFELIKGQGRLEAHKRLKRSTIRAFVVPEADIDQYTKTVDWLVENRVRANLPPVVKARLADIDRQRGVTYEEIARRYGITPATARQYARVVRKASEQVLDMVEKDRLGFVKAKIIAEGIDDKRTQEAVAEVVTEDELDQRGTRAAVLIAQKAAQERTSPLSITELRSEIRKVAHRRSQLGEQLVATQERLDLLRRHSAELRGDSGFAEVVATIGRELPPEV